MDTVRHVGQGISETTLPHEATETEISETKLASLGLLWPNNQPVAELLGSILSYKGLRNDYFVLKSNIPYFTPFYRTRVSAGPPSNVEEYVEQSLDLSEHLTGNSNTVFCIQVEGDSMIGAGIQDNDILVVDRAIEPTDGKIVIASVNSELTVKRLKINQQQITLMPENPSYFPIVISPGIDLKIWGVVTRAIHTL